MDCPNARAIVTPIKPDRKNRKARDANGGASTTIMRADVKADDQISANKSPMPIARKSIFVLHPISQMTLSQNRSVFKG
jgi:hypothetical protein